MQHRAEDVEEKDKSAPMAVAKKWFDDRYRAEIRPRGRWTYEVDLVTTHVIHLPGGPAPGAKASAGGTTATPNPIRTESTLQVPVVVLGRRWAESKARRLVAAAYKRDVREAQPWVVTERA